MENNNRKTFKGEWTCRDCGGSITELPFEPKNTDGLLCKDCFAKSRPNKGGGERHMFQGAWSCSSCTAPITELPFQPASEANLLCRDCFKKNKA